MSEKNVIELNNQSPTAESVISRLHREKDTIDSITAVITYKDGSSSIALGNKDDGAIACDLLILQKYAAGFFDVDDEG